MLIGEYTHTIDDKNRLSLPSKFRQELGKKVVITPGLDNCLWVFTLKQWATISEMAAGSSMGSMLKKDTRSFNRFLFGGAVEAEIDTIGRILVPDFLRNHAGIAAEKNGTGNGTGTEKSVATKAVVIGVQNRVEIWNEKSWQAYKKVVEKEADSLAEKLGQVGVL